MANFYCKIISCFRVFIVKFMLVMFMSSISIMSSGNLGKLSSDEIESLKESSQDGDSYASIKLFEYYYWSLQDFHSAQQWILVAVDQGNLDAKLNYGSLCIDKVFRCDQSQIKGYLEDVLKLGSEAQIVEANLYLGNLLINSDPDKAIKHYMFGALHHDFMSISKILDYWKKNDDVGYKVYFWANVLLKETKKDSAKGEYLVNLIADMEQKIISSAN